MSNLLRKVILIIIFFGFCFNAALGRSNVGSALSQISSFKSALEMFEVDNGFYPTTEEGLDALVEKPQTATNWFRPYIDSVPLDPWGNAYFYRNPGVHSSDGFDIYSLGPDGISLSGGDDPDDLNSWNPNQKIPKDAFGFMVYPGFDKFLLLSSGVIAMTIMLLYLRRRIIVKLHKQ